MRSIYGAWQANARVNHELLNHLTEEMLDAQTPGGENSVAQHLAHMAGVMKDWGSRLDAQLDTLPDLYNAEADTYFSDTFIAEKNLARVRDVMTETEQAVLEVVQSKPEGDRGTLPHPSAAAFLIHMMIHDAHHRGQILLALKTAGYLLPDEDRFWGPWKGE